ncbi:hypothetical protein BOX15_Mlig030891g1 [Macrostomum lignano]|uniref:WSC domain-containing protein n=1 Tax=Macrostomum lignano TaxID=282301 RepID=A0A267E7G2_9PLAT|nr:hypothetical protein BOX15_Mlig030891g4 [Macrostomum lignano]PAA57523.1 hypothetical protein BOX15_Mlig030891g1 [Macrostomum lignano]
MQMSLATSTAVLLISAAILANFFTHVESLMISKKYEYQGCFVHAREAQAIPLGHKVDNSSKMTADVCAEDCSWNDYAYFGLKSGSECWCGNRINSIKISFNFCNRICNGNFQETCGGSSHVQIYKGVSLASLKKNQGRLQQDPTGPGCQ